MNFFLFSQNHILSFLFYRKFVKKSTILKIEILQKKRLGQKS
ncbi:hypothetical protein HMPREF9182_0013 [Streptococcus sp. oral taxon 056 str. F0418]|nr:hypothetical protein HMPREF9182_0013 [Streptococcus sp. oral taxon 056 str. F0418]